MKQENTKELEGQQEQEHLKYEIEQKVGFGTFGVVYQGKIKSTGEKIAIKKVLQDKRYKNREYQIIKEMSHINCVKMMSAYYTNGDKVDEVYLNLVMEYMPENLYEMNKSYIKQNQHIPRIKLKLISYQMFRSLAYINGMGICHRDVKPQNILINQDLNLMKLCDFGSAKKLVKGEPNVAYICSRYYRAPELIFGAVNYTNDIDTWSTACVIAELILGKPLFPGESSVDQLVEIIKILGTPNLDQVKLMNPQYNVEFKFPNIKPQAWSKVFKYKVDTQLVDLLSKLLVYNPKERLRPLEALLHPYFDDIRNQDSNIYTEGVIFPDLFDFTKEELCNQPDLKQILIPSWYKKK